MNSLIYRLHHEIPNPGVSLQAPASLSFCAWVLKSIGVLGCGSAHYPETEKLIKPRESVFSVPQKIQPVFQYQILRIEFFVNIVCVSFRFNTC